MLCALIMAGGIGTRFWPQSTPDNPKQFLSLLNEKSMLQMTYERINKLIPSDRIFIITNYNYIDKIKAIVLIQIKIVAKYENIITIILSQFWGTEQRNKKCQNLVYEYIGQIEKIVQEGIEKGEIKEGDTRAIASEIYGLICSTLVYKKREGEDMDVMRLYHEYENTVINGLRVK